MVRVDYREHDAGKRGRGRPGESPPLKPRLPYANVYSRGFCLQLNFKLSSLRQIDDAAALGTLGQMSEGLSLLVWRERAVRKGAELVGVWVFAGFELFAQGSPSVICFALSGNAVDSEVCNSERRLISISRGSVPSTSSALRSLSPSAWRYFKSRFRSSATRRLSRRLIVAS